MSCCHGLVPQEVRPGTALLRVTELKASGHSNPVPATKPREDSVTVVEPYFSPEKLVSLQKCLRIRSVFTQLYTLFSLVVVSFTWLVYVHQKPALRKSLLSEISAPLIYSSGGGVYVAQHAHAHVAQHGDQIYHLLFASCL